MTLCTDVERGYAEVLGVLLADERVKLDMVGNFLGLHPLELLTPEKPGERRFAWAVGQRRAYRQVGLEPFTSCRGMRMRKWHKDVARIRNSQR